MNGGTQERSITGAPVLLDVVRTAGPIAGGSGRPLRLWFVSMNLLGGWLSPAVWGHAGIPTGLSVAGMVS